MKIYAIFDSANKPQLRRSKEQNSSELMKIWNFRVFSSCGSREHPQSLHRAPGCTPGLRGRFLPRKRKYWLSGSRALQFASSYRDYSFSFRFMSFWIVIVSLMRAQEIRDVQVSVWFKNAPVQDVRSLRPL